MLRDKARALFVGLMVLDGAVGVAAFLLSYSVRTAFVSDPTALVEFSHYVPLLLLAVPTWLLACYWAGLYTSRRLTSMSQELVSLARAGAIATVCCGAAAFALKFDFVSRLFLATFGTLTLLGVTAERIAIKVIARYARRLGYNERHVVLVGDGPTADELVSVLGRPNPWGLQIITHIPFSQLDEGASSLRDLISEHVVDEVILAAPHDTLMMVDHYLLECELAGINAHVALQRDERRIAKPRADDLAGIPLLTFGVVPNSKVALFVKRFFDVVVAVALLIVLIPVFAIIALAIKATSPGPVLFKQRRVGLNGRPFTLYKFRSMVTGAELLQHTLLHLNEMKGPVFKIQNDPRLTRIGAFLRRTSLDELPQLLNIIMGEMSLVGPRPAVPTEVSRYAPWQRRRLSMRPGLTCLWQISGRSTIDDFDEWMALDLRYIDNWALTLDAIILLRTIPAVVLGRGAA